MTLLETEEKNLRAMSFNQEYIETSLEIMKRWDESKLLSNIKDSYVARQVSQLMENQMRLNERGLLEFSVPEGANYQFNEAQWKRISIPVVRRVFGEEFLGYKLVGVQVLSQGQDKVYSQNLQERMVIIPVERRSRMMKVDWNPPTWKENGGCEYKNEIFHRGIDAEAQATADYAEAIRDDIDREIIHDLTVNAASNMSYEYKDPDYFLSLVEGMSSYISSKINGREPNWMVVSPEIVKLMGEQLTPPPEETTRHSIRWAGTYSGRWKVYEDSSFYKDKVLMGYKSPNHYLTGYIYSPFLPVNPNPSYSEGGVDKSGFTENILAKRLINPDFYGVLNLKNLPEVSNTSVATEQEGDLSDTK